ncbi:hypothetical protein QTA12_24985, partial [Escherichia coli]|nr:hypothetical protein [Escherichia coli]
FSDPGPVFHTIVSIKNDGHYFCRAGGNRPDGLNEPVTLFIQIQFPHGSDWSEVLRLTDIVTEKVSSGRTAGGHHHRHTGYTWSVSVN